MKKMSITQKVECLTNALRYYGIPEKYHVETSDARMGQSFAIGEKSDGSLKIHTNYMTYDEMNCFFYGYAQHMTKPLK